MDENEIWNPNFAEITKNDIRDFLQAKEAYLKNPNVDTRYEMLHIFQMLHTSLKKECLAGTISPQMLQQLTDFFKEADLD